MTKVMKNSETARFKSSAFAPISPVKPYVSAFPTLPLSRPLKRYNRERNGSRKLSSFRFRDLESAFFSAVSGM
jgi:hypothetical protein